jgi:hypothetical protein
MIFIYAFLLCFLNSHLCFSNGQKTQDRHSATGVRYARGQLLINGVKAFSRILVNAMWVEMTVEKLVLVITDHSKSPSIC